MDEVINVESWKGKDIISVQEGGGYYCVIEHRKSKETGEPTTIEHMIPKSHIETLIKLIDDNCVIGQEYKYKYMVRKLLEHYKFHEIENAPLEFFMDAFNGGKYRAKYYFPYYYYPMKVLEYKKLATYLGRGGIIRNG